MTQQVAWNAAARAEEETVLDVAYSAVENTARNRQREIEELRSEASKLFGDPERLPDYREIRVKIDSLKKETEELEQWLCSLYFGRIDFQHEGKTDPSTYYIGKIPNGTSKARKNCENAGIMLVDWRAPVAELFYTPNLFPAR